MADEEFDTKHIMVICSRCDHELHVLRLPLYVKATGGNVYGAAPCPNCSSPDDLYDFDHPFILRAIKNNKDLVTENGQYYYRFVEVMHSFGKNLAAIYETIQEMNNSKWRIVDKEG